MIRKQVYIEPAQQRKLRMLAGQWNCTEADVVRRAIDRLPVSDDPIVRALYESGAFVPPPEEHDMLSDEGAEQIEREIDTWALAKEQPVRLAEAVDEDREDRI